MIFIPRPSQSEILQYTHGTLGISAVPGSGKTHTLSALAAQIISNGQLEPEQEVLIVTLVNSAVDNFSAHIGDFIQARGLIPQLGYRVRTLHGLAHDIVREDPPLVGLDKKFSIVDETSSSAMVAEAARAWSKLIPISSICISLHSWRIIRPGGYVIKTGQNWLKPSQPVSSGLPKTAGSRPINFAMRWTSSLLPCRWLRWAGRSIPITSAPSPIAALWTSMISSGWHTRCWTPPMSCSNGCGIAGRLSLKMKPKIHLNCRKIF